MMTVCPRQPSDRMSEPAHDVFASEQAVNQRLVFQSVPQFRPIPARPFLAAAAEGDTCDNIYSGPIAQFAPGPPRAGWEIAQQFPKSNLSDNLMSF